MIFETRDTASIVCEALNLEAIICGTEMKYNLTYSTHAKAWKIHVYDMTESQQLPTRFV